MMYIVYAVNLSADCEVLRSDCTYAHADLGPHHSHVACDKCCLWWLDGYLFTAYNCISMPT